MVQGPNPAVDGGWEDTHAHQLLPPAFCHKRLAGYVRRPRDAVNRLNISEQDPKADLPELVGDVANKAVKGVAKHKTEGALDSAGEKLSNLLAASTIRACVAPSKSG